MAEGLPIVDPNDPYAAQYEIAKRKLQKEKEDVLKKVAETYGGRGRFYSGILPKQEAKVEESYGQQLSDVAQNIAIERAAEEKGAQRVKEAQVYQTSERVASQAWQSAENTLGRQFTTEERKAVQDFNSLEAGKQRDWGSAEAALGRTFSTSERQAIQAYQTGEREASQAYQTGERFSAQAWQSAETALGRQFTTSERMAIQDWQSAQNTANQAWQTLENDKNRALSTAELLGYFVTGETKQYTMAGQQQQIAATETAEQQAAAEKMGFKNVTEMNTYMADPAMAVKSGIYSYGDLREIRRLVDEGPTGDNWLSGTYGLTRDQAKSLLASRGM